jgi:hypothetical protein
VNGNGREDRRYFRHGTMGGWPMDMSEHPPGRSQKTPLPGVAFHPERRDSAWNADTSITSKIVPDHERGARPSQPPFLSFVRSAVCPARQANAK